MLPELPSTDQMLQDLSGFDEYNFLEEIQKTDSQEVDVTFLEEMIGRESSDYEADVMVLEEILERESPGHEADVTIPIQDNNITGTNLLTGTNSFPHEEYVIEECIQKSSEFNGLEGCVDQQNSCYQEGAGLEGAPLAKKAAASYECRTCERTFSRKDNLKRHILVHTREKPHVCPLCNKRFARPGDLKRHKKRVHQNRAVQRSFRCGTCGETFNNMAPYQAHVRNAHQAAKRTSEEEAPKSKRSRPTPPHPPAPVAAASSSWESDPLSVPANLLANEDPITRRMYEEHWLQIRTRFHRGNPLLDWYNFRLTSLDPQELKRHTQRIFYDQSTVFKLNISFGFILRNNDSGALQYYHSSQNNNQVFDSPFQIQAEHDLVQVNEALQEFDILEWAR
ncbi:hypothetical protein ACROYT_G011063 [Oculina patagonica]